MPRLLDLIQIWILCTFSLADRLPPDLERIFDDLSWRSKVRILTKELQSVCPGENQIDDLRGRIGDDLKNSKLATEYDDEGTIKLKLFRSMNEAVSESELKSQRAELIRRYYNNSKVFEIGYMMGDITDEYKTIKDISDILIKLTNDWKPIEHINVYEQIANKAIEIINLIEIMKGIEKSATTL